MLRERCKSHIRIIIRSFFIYTFSRVRKSLYQLLKNHVKDLKKNDTQMRFAPSPSTNRKNQTRLHTFQRQIRVPIAQSFGTFFNNNFFRRQTNSHWLRSIHIIFQVILSSSVHVTEVFKWKLLKNMTYSLILSMSHITLLLML